MASHKLTNKTLAEKWQAYKEHCDSHTVQRTEFSQRESKFVTQTVLNPITYTIKGFCQFIGMTENNFYETYAPNPKFGLVIARMREECENNARSRFEDGSIPTQLSGLWMSRYDGYTTKQEQKVTGTQQVVIVDDCDQ